MTIKQQQEITELKAKIAELENRVEVMDKNNRTLTFDFNARGTVIKDFRESHKTLVADLNRALGYIDRTNEDRNLAKQPTGGSEVYGSFGSAEVASLGPKLIGDYQL